MTTPEGAPAPDAPSGAAFTPPASQADLDRIVEQRLARERSKFSDYDDLKAKAEKFDQADAASKSELQQAQDALADRDRKLAELPTEVRKQSIRFASMASQRGFLDPEDALVFIEADLADADAVKAALDDLAERKPHLVRIQKAKAQERPKPKAGEDNGGTGGTGGVTGKERAAQALRDFSRSR